MVRIDYHGQIAEVHGDGRIECDPSPPAVFVARLALAVRAAAYPLLPVLSIEVVTGTVPVWTTEEILAHAG